MTRPITKEHVIPVPSRTGTWYVTVERFEPPRSPMLTTVAVIVLLPLVVAGAAACILVLFGGLR